MVHDVQSYSITQDLCNTKANITFGQLIQASPKIRAELSKGMRKPVKEEVNAYAQQPST